MCIRIISLIFIAFLAGCEYQTVMINPEIEGTLTANGKAASSTEIFYGFSGDSKEPCPSIPSTTTDSNGKFHLPAITDRLPVKTYGALRYATTESFMCFKHQGKLIVGIWLFTKLDDKQKYVSTCRFPVAPDAIAEDRLICNTRRSNYAIKVTAE